MKRIWLSGLLMAFCYQAELSAHCQMPCGIYHDDMVFDQIDQYIETMVKGLSMLNDSKFTTVQDRNEFVRWVIQKENSSDEIAQMITIFFLQQKIKPGESDTTERVLSAHKLLFLLVQLKQTVDFKVLNDFYEEWEKFKLMFHVENYKCKMQQIKLKKWAEKYRTAKQQGGPLPGNTLEEEEEEKEREHEHNPDGSHRH